MGVGGCELVATVTASFYYTGAPVTFVVPPQVTELVIECWGAGGFNAYDANTISNPNQHTYSLGGYVKGSIAVTAGDSYIVTVGGNGNTGQNGFNGGGAGGTGLGSQNYQYGCFPGAPGGGATDIRHSGTALANRIMVAGGGGGGGPILGTGTVTQATLPTSPYPYTATPPQPFYYSGGNSYGASVGADGNGTVGGEATHGTTSGETNLSGTGGGAGGQSSGGAAGTGSGTVAGTAGALGLGGNGGNAESISGDATSGGGGGGGGYYGGGGGASGISDGLVGNSDGIPTGMGGGGGAGSNYVSGSFSAVTNLGATGTQPPASAIGAAAACNITYLQPPTIPTVTNTTPNNTGVAGEFDYSSFISFGWAFSSLAPGQTQTRFDIRYSSNGGSTWTVLTESGSSLQYYQFDPFFFTAGTTYDVQVRVYDSSGTPSGYSSSVVFEAVELPGAPTITAPTAGSNITTTTFTVSWTIPTINAQSKYEVVITDDDGNILLDSGTVTSATKSYSATLTFSESENVNIRVRYQTTAGGTVWSSFAQITAFLNLDPPDVPSVMIGADDESGAISLVITNGDTSGNATVYNDVYRTDITNGLAEIRIATQVAPNSTYVDYTPGSGIFYAYRVRAYSAEGGVADAT